MLNEKKKNRLKIILILVLMSISVAALGYSFGFVTMNPKVTTANYFSISEIKFGISDEVDNIILGDVVPTLDKFGILNDSFEFTVENKSENKQHYLVKLVDGDQVSTIANREIRYQLSINDQVVGIYSLSSGGFIDTGDLLGGQKIKYAIKVWLNYDSSVTNGVWNKIIYVDAGNTTMDTSGANIPNLADNMIPVYYDEDSEIWRKASQDNLDKNHRWYDYDSLIWANAVTVREKSRETYQNAPVGTEILMDDINSMWVWIPRFKYTIFNSSFKNTKPMMIDVTFEAGLKSTGTVKCQTKFGSNGTSEVCTDEANNGIIQGTSTYTHPAFTFNNQELDGLWVAKFEASANPDSTCASAPSTTYCNNGKNDIYIKPDLKSLSYITMANLQNSFRRMELANNIYGFAQTGVKLNSDGTIASDSNDLDIHMIKNSEWGAVTYLYHSQYGKYNNIEYTNQEKELYYNNSEYTGSSSGGVNGQRVYHYDALRNGTGASTTGNIYGVYDLNGGKGEMVMLNFQTTYKEFVPLNASGFKESLNMMYYDAYYSDSNIGVTKLGDALKETNWYNDTRNLSVNKVLYRGGTFKNNASGIFGINSMATTMSDVGSRPVLKIDSRIYITKW